MNLLALTGSTLLGAMIAVSINPMALAQDNTFSGTVETVLDDGFILNTGERSLKVDSDDRCDDKTLSKLSQGDKLTVTGEFDDDDNDGNKEFDAHSITKEDNVNICTKDSDD